MRLQSVQSGHLSEAVVLSHISTMLRSLKGQISAHCRAPKERNAHLRLFHLDQGPHTVLYGAVRKPISVYLICILSANRQQPKKPIKVHMTVREKG